MVGIGDIENRMTERLYDRLPFEVAQVLHWVGEWHEHDCQGQHECVASDLITLADAARALAEWRARQSIDDRVYLDVDTDTHRLFDQRPRHTDKTRPKLHVVPRPTGWGHDDNKD